MAEKLYRLTDDKTPDTGRIDPKFERGAVCLSLPLLPVPDREVSLLHRGNTRLRPVMHFDAH